MLNRVILAGRICNDLELKKTASDVEVLSFTIACERDFKDKNGEKQTDFFDIIAFKGTALFVSKYFSKGRAIIVDGKLQARKWQDKDGNNRKSVEVIADNVYFGDSKNNNEQQAQAQPQVDLYPDNDLPF